MSTGDAPRDLFAIASPLGFSVQVSARYWDTIVGKHPDLADRLLDVQAALREPDEIRRSGRDPAILLFYRSDGSRHRWVVAAAKHAGDRGFLVTAYRTDAIKEGERLWPE
ncbi:MAG: hypothetical protein B6D46_03600 [Polyangiaceae bacterium UTPRO1]|jgi:plasmid stabilization system protein ParE|nr:hypothetical protein [Myxococcales bacterium]OQY68493.1 MAG: hypothetical protein B6D46_03600 [Polyangiaceae bacterium UTPRO1]